MIDRALRNLTRRLTLDDKALRINASQQRIGSNLIQLEISACFRVLHAEQHDSSSPVPRKRSRVFQRRLGIHREVSREENVSERKHDANLSPGLHPVNHVNHVILSKYLQDIEFHAKLRKLS